MRTDQDILDEANELCAAFASAARFETPEGHQFHADPNPRSQNWFDLAVVAFEVLRETDLHDVLCNLEIDRPTRPAKLAGMALARKARR